MKRANALVAAGAALLIIGLGLVWFMSRDDDDAPDERMVPVLVARDDLAAGESGDAAIAGGKVSIEQVPESRAQAGALIAPTDLAGTILATAVADGEQVLSTAVRPANLRAASITIPKDKQAVAVSVGFTEGGAGYVGVGDRINLLATLRPSDQGEPDPLTKLLLTNVEVLDVSTELTPQRATETTTPGAPPGRAAASTITLLLALDTRQAESVVFASTFNHLWITVLPEDAPDSTSEGVTYGPGYVDGGS